jgi:hypothetical protein
MAYTDGKEETERETKSSEVELTRSAMTFIGATPLALQDPGKGPTTQLSRTSYLYRCSALLYH